MAPGSAALGLGGESRREALEVDQRVQVAEGHVAFIRSGRVEPLGRRHRPGYGYQVSGTGFYVLPRLNGEQVTLDLVVKPILEPPALVGM